MCGVVMVPAWTGKTCSCISACSYTHFHVLSSSTLFSLRLSLIQLLLIPKSAVGAAEWSHSPKKLSSDWGDWLCWKGWEGQRWLWSMGASNAGLNQFSPEQFIQFNFPRTSDGFCVLLPISLWFFHMLKEYFCTLFWKCCIVLPY